MGKDGYLSLADFGISKVISEQTTSSTLQYLAPEIIKNSDITLAIDWWAIGILIYEMICGFPPFYHKNDATIKELI